MVGYTLRSSRWRADAGVPSFCKLYAVVMRKEPRLWNCPKSSCHGAFPDTRNPLEPSLSITAPTWGTRGVVLLSSRVWKDVNSCALEIGISCTYSNPVVTEGQKHTHTHQLKAPCCRGQRSSERMYAHKILQCWYCVNIFEVQNTEVKVYVWTSTRQKNSMLCQ